VGHGQCLQISPGDSSPATLTVPILARAIGRAGLPTAERPDGFGHWLDLEGRESRLRLVVHEGFVRCAGFRLVPEESESVVGAGVGVFKGLGWLIADEDGPV
jgi:hypothetical protein